MNVSRALRMLPLLGVFALPACDASRATDPIADDVVLTEEDRIVLDVISSPDAIQAAMDLIDIPARTAGRHGMAWGSASDAQANGLLARERFQEALRAMNQGDSVQALERAREARRLVVRAMVAVGGPRAVPRMAARAEGLAARVGNEPAMYADAYRLRNELNGLATQARQRLQLRDSIGAGACAVLAEQRHHQRFAHPTTRPGGAEVAVGLGHTSVTFSTGLVTEAGGPSDEQANLLAVADDYATAADEALASGDEQAAVHLSDLALWTSLEAVVWPDGVSTDEANAMLALAGAQYTEAAATELTDLEVQLLDWASELIDYGTATLEQTPPRGTGALWRASVICEWVIG